MNFQYPDVQMLKLWSLLFQVMGNVKDEIIFGLYWESQIISKFHALALDKYKFLSKQWTYGPT